MKTERRLWLAPLVGVVAAVGCAQVFGLDKEYRLTDDASAVGVLGGACPQTGALACSGHAQKSKLICGLDSKWATNGTCDGDTLCDTATGLEQGTCKSPVAVCTGKHGADVVCEGTKRVRCGPDLVTTEEVESCSAQTGLCIAGACVLPPSCKDLSATCGPGGDESCCAIRAVPGGSYNRSNDPSYPATVSSFFLDRFEITVGRFRKFVAEYPGNKPKAGDGAHPRIEGSGWDEAWKLNLPADKPALLAEVKCEPSSMTWTWTDAPGVNENLPMNCISWYVALAFCAWDGGRLPTEAEWNYAAAAGASSGPIPGVLSAPMVRMRYTIVQGMALRRVTMRVF